VQALYQAAISRPNLLFGRPWSKSEDLKSLYGGAHLSGCHVVLAIPLLLAPLRLGFLLSVLLLLATASLKSAPRERISLLGGEIVKTPGLTIILRKAAAALLV
jgi:hypothetical protein